MSPVREDNHMNKNHVKNVSRGRKSSPKPEIVVVTASQVRNLVVNDYRIEIDSEIAYHILDILQNITIYKARTLDDKSAYS